MNTKIIRVLSLVLAVLMLSAVFVSCKKDGDGDSATTTVATTEGTHLYEDLGMDLRDYKGKQMKIWYSNGSLDWSPFPLEVKVEDTESDIVSKAGYQRNEQMKTLLGIDVVYTVSSSNPKNSDTEMLRSLRTSGDIAEYDMVMTGARPAGVLALEGFYADLTQSPHIKAGSYYYENQVNEQLKIKGKQYFALGYYSQMNTAAMDTVYTNMQILEDNAHVTKDELYKLAFEKKWTLDKLLEYGKSYVKPETGNTDYNVANVALILSNQYCQCVFFDLGGEVVNYNATQNSYNVVIEESKNVNILKDIRSKISQSADCMLVDNKNNGATMAYLAKAAPFLILTYKNIKHLLDHELQLVTIFMPPPTYSEGEPTRAYTDGDNLNVAGIPADVGADAAKFDKAGYLYEFFMVQTYETVYPAFYEKTFKTRYQPDENSRKVFDIIASSRVIDLPNVYQMYGTWTVAEAVRGTNEPGYSTKKISSNIKAALKTKGLSN